ncbi:unnamed protein product, partial [Thlaspi arvense]
PHYEDTFGLLIPSSTKPPDSLHHLWRATNGALLVGVNLLWRGIDANSCCTRCGHQESISHIWFECPFAQAVWRLSPLTPNPATLPSDTDSRSLMWSLYNTKNLPSSGLLETPLFPWILWYLWTSRNKLIFEGTSFSASDLVAKASSEASHWHSANQTPIQTPSKSLKPSRPPPPPTTTICCIDGARIAKTKRRFISSDLVAEALEVLAALSDALSEEIREIHLLSDSEVLINTLLAGSDLTETAGILIDV